MHQGFLSIDISVVSFIRTCISISWQGLRRGALHKLALEVFGVLLNLGDYHEIVDHIIFLLR
jgi:hypothetical protein